ncbi:hypothetical protein L6452_35056 [Arctium lappa]|uniref:Uncharacterized protein n=1 Tax=Arctium lappa TaxID=4217 RepID=A0ACB8YK69_ARCLA|nr:hypothetical protein L6452_35056 [Arctium lappa]
MSLKTNSKSLNRVNVLSNALGITKFLRLPALFTVYMDYKSCVLTLFYFPFSIILSRILFFNCYELCDLFV